MESHVVNMFAAKKVKLHGMKSEKMTTRDKILQYKGLINLYRRDRKIIELDTNVGKKKLQRELKDMQKCVYNDRRALDNAVRGDKQRLRNTLADHRELQLAFQNSQPKTVIEEIDQLNFNKRKFLDKLLYEKKNKSQKLIDLKLEQASLEDRLKYAFLGQIRQEKEAQIITGKVQDAILRTEGAWAIHRIYREILDIMKKDALYFDSIIATVRNDGYSQSKCFLGATKLGQLATEYLDDRRQEFNTLEKIILKDMTTRKTDIRVLSETVDNASANIKQLLRKESDITTCVLHLPDTPSVEQLNKDVAEVNATLNVLKNATLVPSFEQIHPCLVEQKKQKRRLKRLAKKFERCRDTLLNKRNHAELMDSMLKTTMSDTVMEYKSKKQELITSIDELNKQKENYEKNILKNRELAAKIRICLRQLLQLSYEVRPREEVKKKSSSIGIHPFSKQPAAPPPEPQKKRELPDDEIDGSKIIPIILKKFTALMQTYFAKKEEVIDDSLKQFEVMMQERIITERLGTQEKLSTSSLLQGLYTEAPLQVTREDIKKHSAEIVAANTKNEDLIPLITISTRPRSKFLKLKKK